MSEDFKIEDIGKIDLNEAEAIANEDILFITEAELIEDLEEFNIIPLKDGKYADSAFTEIQKDVEIESSTAVITEDEISEDKFVATEETELPLDDIDSTDIDASHIEKQKVEIEKTQPESNRSSKRDYSYDDEEELLIFNEQKYYSDTLKTQKLSKIQFLDVESGVIISEDILPDDKIDIQAPVADEAAKPVDDDDINWIPLEKVGYQETVESDKAEITDDLEKDKSKKKSVESQAERIDNLKEVEFEILGESEELRRKEFEKRLSERSMIEPEFFLDIDRNKILSLDMDDVDLIDRDLYIDDDLDFIHSSIIQEDYSLYIKNIDELYDSEQVKKVSSAIDLLGLTIEELRILDEQLYGKDYLEKNLYDSLDFFTVKKKKSRKIAHSCTYFIPDEEELNIKEKKSIEEDLSSPNAFIYIEDINAIKRLLAISRESKKEVFEQIEVKKVDPIVEEEVNKELKNEATKKYAKIFDITDKVVIIDDELDVDRFVKEFPTEKQGSVKKLMRYLDGLFEKLPENTIRKFADSEYYDLYIQVLNDLGV